MYYGSGTVDRIEKLMHITQQRADVLGTGRTLRVQCTHHMAALFCVK